VEKFKKNTDYIIAKSNNNAFLNIDLEVKDCTIHLYDNISGASIFGTDYHDDNDHIDFDTDFSSFDEEDMLNQAVIDYANISY